MGIFSGNNSRGDSRSSKSQSRTRQESSAMDDQSKFSDLPSSVRDLRPDDVSSINFGESVTGHVYKHSSSASPTSMTELDMLCIVEGGEEVNISAIRYSSDSPERTGHIKPHIVTPTSGENRSLLSMPDSKHSVSTFGGGGSNSMHTSSSKETLPCSNTVKPHLLISNMVYLSLMIDPSITKEKTRASHIVQDTLRKEIDKIYPIDSIVHRRKSQPIDVDDISFVGESLSDVVEVAEYHITKRNFSAAVEIYKTLLKGQTREAVGGQHDVAITVRELAALYLYKGDLRRSYKCIAEVLALQTEERRPEGVAIALAEKGLVLFSNNNMDDAMKAWQESLQVVCKVFGYGHIHVPLLLNNMACYHLSKGEFDDALSKFQESLQLQRYAMQTGGTHVCDADASLLNIASTLCNMGAVFVKQNEYHTAIEVIEEALLVQESVQDGELIAIKTKEYLDVIISYQENSVDDMAKENNQQSDDLHLSRTRNLFGDNDGVPMRAVSNNTIDLSDFIQLGSLEREWSPTERVRVAVQSSVDACRGDSDDDAFPFHQYCHPELKKMSIPVSVDDENVIDAELHLKNIFLQATEHLKLDQTKEALDLFQSSMKSIIDKYGEIHHLVGTMLHNLGIVHLYDESYVLALQLFQKAVHVRSTALGQTHPDVAASILKTAMVQIARQNLDCANVIFLQLLHTQRRELGYNHPQISLFLNNIGCIHYEFGGFLAAKKAFEEALEMQRTHSDNTQDESTLLALTYTLCNIGFVHVRRKEFSNAIVAFEEALDIQRRVLDPDHPSLESIVRNLDYINENKDFKSLARPVGCQVSDVLSRFTNTGCGSVNP